MSDAGLLDEYGWLLNIMCTHYTRDGMARLKGLHAEIVKRGLTV